ncbi:MAG: hypothetical protein IJS80_06210 [Lachnospiraceae bacterium]|jgi:archaellum biogenesis protein FlaJ (TadC family)|nr:hypothetical protein [Lachnospiraceae bacterium]
MKKRMEVAAVGVIEIILILVVLIALVLIFKEQLTSLINDIFSKINTNATKIIN